MASEVVRVLLVEDDPDDVVLVRAALKEDLSTEFALTVVSEAGQAAERLAAGRFDIALLDLSLPDAQGIDSFSAVLGHASHTPIIVLTGLDDEAVALQAMHDGAQDYLSQGARDRRAPGPEHPLHARAASAVGRANPTPRT